MSHPGAYNIHDDLFGAKSYGKLEENGLTLNYEKCKVGVDKMVYMETYCLEMVFVCSCHPCQIVDPKAKPEPIRSTKLPESPWKDISIDLLEITTENHLLVVVDYYSRWIEAILVRKTDAQHVIKCLKAIFRTHALPETIRSDNGPPFAFLNS